MGAGARMDILDLKMDLFKKVCIVSGLGGIVPGSFSIYDISQEGASWTQAIEALQFRQGLLDSFAMITAMGVLAILCHLLYIEKKNEEGYYFLEARTWFIFCAISTLIIIIIPEAPGDWAILDDFTDLYPLSNAVQNLRKGILLQNIPGFIESIYSIEIVHMLRDEGPLTRQEIVDRCQRGGLLDIFRRMQSSRLQRYPQSLLKGSEGYIEQQLQDFNRQLTRRKFRKFFREFIMEKVGDRKTYRPPSRKAIENFLDDLCDWGILKNIDEKYKLFPADAYKYHNLGEIAEERHQFKKAEDFYKKALELFKKYEHPPLLVDTLIRLSILYQKKNWFNKSVVLLGEALQITKTYLIFYYDRYIHDEILINLGLNLETMGEESFVKIWMQEFEECPPLREIRKIMESLKKDRS
jgi:hypothetical protein